MSNFANQFSFLTSMYRGPVILNMATPEEEAAEAAAQAKSPPVETEDALEGFDESTPAGQKFKAMRIAKKDAEAKAAAAEQARALAEAKAQGMAEAFEQAKQPEKKPDPVNDIHPDDKKVVTKVLTELGLDEETIRSIRSVKDLPQQTQQLVMERRIDSAADAVTKKYANSVPFDKAATIKYAVDNGMALALPNAPLEKILEIAHKEMNEEKLDQWRSEQRAKQVKSPQIQNSGTGKKEVRTDKPASVSDFRKQAHEMLG